MSDNILFLKIVVSFATRILVPSGLKFLIHCENGTYASKCMLEMYLRSCHFDLEVIKDFIVKGI